MGRQMYGVKWHNFKLVLVAQKYMQDSADALPTPRLINLNTDPQERERVRCPTRIPGRRLISTASSPSSRPVPAANR